MRLRTATCTIVLAGLCTGPAHAFEGGRLLRCQQGVTAAAARFFSGRRQALGRCVEKALRCPAALTSTATAAADTCLAAVAARCRSRLVTMEGAERSLERSGPHCTDPPPGMGVSLTGFLADDGLAFASLAATCPEMAVAPDSPADVSRCQRAALTCVADSAFAAAMPRGPDLLVRLGVPLGDGPGCLRAGLCGNGVFDGDEECDGGPANSNTAPDACRTTCVDAHCGDGVVDDGEDCDDGNAVDGDGCEHDCTLTGSVCGNGIVEGDEQCDDGNLNDGDGCDGTCTREGPGCGNGVVEGDEECDDGRQNSNLLPDHCRNDCSAPSCGDHVVDPRAGERCEPPGTILCTPDCRLRLPLSALPVVSRAAAPAADLLRCQGAIAAAGARVFTRVRGLVESCVAGVARCVIGIPEARDPDGSRAAACLERANRRCTAAAAARDALRTSAVTRLAARCRSGAPPAAIALTRLLDPAAGLGFDREAATCPSPGAGDPTISDLLACVVQVVSCDAEGAVARSVPRAPDLLSNLDLDPEEVFPCVTGLAPE